MKRLFLLTTILLLGVSTFAQNLEYKDGRYYKKGMLYTGMHTEHHENGAVSVELNISNGLEHGSVQYYYPTGIKKEYREYNEGKKNGLWITWNEEGVKIAEASYKSDIKDGPWNIWNSSGVKLYEMNYSNGAKSGIWRQWDENGTLVMERNYDI